MTTNEIRPWEWKPQDLWNACADILNDLDYYPHYRHALEVAHANYQNIDACYAGLIVHLLLDPSDQTLNGVSIAMMCGILQARGYFDAQA